MSEIFNIVVSIAFAVSFFLGCVVLLVLVGWLTGFFTIDVKLENRPHD